MTGTIYGIFDPRDRSRCVYVGQTTTPLHRRLSRHLASMKAGRKTRFFAWLQQHPAAVIRPLLEHVPREQLTTWEMDFMARLSVAGHPLLNKEVNS